jgi:membrane-associated HD superfamily phosphohydrolase
MEYLILLLIFFFAPLIIGRFFLTKSDLLLMTPFKATILPYLILAFFIYVITFILTVIRAIRTCPTPTETNQLRSFGIVAGLKLGLFTSIFACLMYLMIAIFPILTVPFIAVTIIPNAIEIGEGFYVAIGGFIGYWLGRMFINLC